MITENTIRENIRHVDDGSINQQNDISFEDLYVSNATSTVTTDKFSDTDSHDRDATVNNNSNKIIESSQFTTIIPSCRTGISILMELPIKIINGVSDFLNFQSTSPESEIPAKRPYSPRPHHNAKQTPTDIARGRGRGRGRSQLRRSGVSQTRHRQERIRQRLTADIQDDFKSLHEFQDLQNFDEEIPSTPCVDDKGRKIRYGANGAEPETETETEAETETTASTKYPFFFGYCDVRRRKRKQHNKNLNSDRISIKNNCKVRYIPECPIDIVACKQSDDIVQDVESETRINRKRLQSDRSVDSEDSCCIVFETGSESDYEIDYDYTTTDDEEDEEEGEENEDVSRLKVRFSSHPRIHTMITWDYAYRAARRGPWEEMARDRERFKYRINCIARVLDPILVPQHRSEIWQHRFAVEI